MSALRFGAAKFCTGTAIGRASLRARALFHTAYYAHNPATNTNGNTAHSKHSCMSAHSANNMLVAAALRKGCVAPNFRV